MNIRSIIPNLLTTANLITGVAGIINVFIGDYTNTIMFILLAGLFDFLDGFAARMLKVTGDFGKELDSLADMVTFGVLPAVYLFSYSRSLGHEEWITYSNLLIVAFSAFRLAKFNIDTRQSDSFIGLPTPANAILVCTFADVMNDFVIWPNPFLILAITSSILLVSPLKMMALKFKNLSIRENFFKYLFLALVLLFLVLFGIQTLPYVIPLYLLLSILGNLIQLPKKQHQI